nr:hypothetical protein GCM10010200_048470 [Actinomadura rugatobispora]
MIAMLVATVGIVAAILIGDAPAVFAPIVGGLFAVLIILATGALLSSRIILTSNEIIVRWLFIRQRRSRPRVTEVVRATITAPRGSPGESLFLLDAHRNLLIRVSTGAYRREDLDRLVKALGVPCDGPDHPVNANEFAQTYPGLVSWAERHPYRIAFAVAGVICAAVMALALVSIATAS